MSLLNGLTSATYTPMARDGALALDVIPGYVDYLISVGMTGMYVCGSTGEGINLSVEEREQTAEAFVRAAKGRIPVVIQVGTNSITDCERLSAHAQKIGATAISANAPSYFKIGSVDGLAAWTIRIAAAAPKLPFYYYHIPVLTGVAVDLVDYVKKVEGKIACFGGIKYTDTKVYEYQDALLYGAGKYETLWGCDEMFLSALAVGAPGGVGSTFAFLPNTFKQIGELWKAGDIVAAGKTQLRVWHYVKVLNQCGPFHSLQKLLLGKIGFESGVCRMPIPPVPEGAFAKVEAGLKEIGYFEWEKNIFKK